MYFSFAENWRSQFSANEKYIVVMLRNFSPLDRAGGACAVELARGVLLSVDEVEARCGAAQGDDELVDSGGRPGERGNLTAQAQAYQLAGVERMRNVDPRARAIGQLQAIRRP